MNKETSKLAIWSFILGIISIFFIFIGSLIGNPYSSNITLFYISSYILRIGLFSTLTAFIFGIIGLKEAYKNNKKGKAFAITGIIISSIIILLSICTWIIAIGFGSQL